MKKIIYTFSIALTALMFTQCADWTTPEKMYDEPVNSNSEEYYKALREYKKTDHSICFGWFSGWTGAGTDLYNQLRGIPDSMDVRGFFKCFIRIINRTPTQLSFCLRNIKH